MAEDQKTEKKPNVFVRIGREFHDFISRGNVIDLAVGVIIGGAFTAIVNSLVNDILMPIIGAIMAGINIKSLAITLPWSFFGLPRVQILVGSFLQAIITFLLTAICVFIIVKIMNTVKNKMAKKKEEAPAPPAPDPQLVLLTEIRDLLKAQAAYYEVDSNNETEE